MSILPDRVQDLLDFMDQHATTWQANAVAIGLTTGQAGSFKTTSGNARTAYNTQLAAMAAAKSATKVAQSNTRIAKLQCAEFLAIIKAFADAQANPAAVYALAQIPQPAAPSPAPPPGVPFDFKVALAQNGAVTLAWKCTNPAGIGGTIYEVRRRVITSTGAFTFIGATGTRTFTDEALTSGSPGVTYQITAVRSTVRGLPGQFNVNFGVGGGGLTVESVTTDSSMKMAA